MKIAVTILSIILLIAIFIQYRFGVINHLLIELLLWATVGLYAIYLITKIRRR